jgi:hypothetical protein
MTDYCAFVPVVNRPDLLQNVVAAASALWDNFTIIDNSPGQWVTIQYSVNVFHPPVPLSFTQTMNWEMEETLRQKKRFCVHMHSDAVIPTGACEKLLEFARKVDAENPRWGVIYTLYDVLAVYNPQVCREIGGYDTNFAAYFSDNDYYHRMEMAGWTRINSGIEVGHVGSQTINSDPYLKHTTAVTFPLYREYYKAKWGGEPGQERFTYPFSVPPENWK